MNMPEKNIKALAAEAITIKPAGDWGCQALQRQFNVGYGIAVQIMGIIRGEGDPLISTEPNLLATAEGQPEQSRTLDPNICTERDYAIQGPHFMLEESTHVASHDHQSMTAFNAPKTRKPRSDSGQPRPRAPKPTAPESAPALTITEVPAPDTIALTFHLPAGEAFGLLQYFAQSGRADESAYIARQIALFHAAL